tara:strand:+ start:247 stop:366 length:120 start_codon:yes stop_codon:yes gene_type:complete
MIKFIWEKLKAHKETIFVTIPNKYMGVVLLLILLAIWYK